METNDTTIFPSIVFKVKDGYFSVDSKYISGILKMPEIQKLPEAPYYCTGFFINRGQVVQTIDMRTLFGLQSINAEYEEFVSMIDARKQDHINWITELECCHEEGREFTLAKDHHQCALGKWYDSFKINNNSVMFHLKKLEDPHAHIHKAAREDEVCAGAATEEERKEMLDKAMNDTKEKYMPAVLGLLDECKEVFRASVFREMVLVLNCERGIGMVVDEVLSVEDLEAVGEHDGSNSLSRSPYIKGVTRSKSFNNMILEVDAEKLINLGQ
ncbi:MAG: chemotaxis protein CheW [Oscillospiraceae bacterium]|nr:chemotaxis protein CheW [Oscillospiraceae bacterium]